VKYEATKVLEDDSASFIQNSFFGVSAYEVVRSLVAGSITQFALRIMFDELYSRPQNRVRDWNARSCKRRGQSRQQSGMYRVDVRYVHYQVGGRTGPDASLMIAWRSQ
jgi:hypothetical protein